MLLAVFTISAGVGVAVGKGVQAMVKGTELDCSVCSFPSGSVKVAWLEMTEQAGVVFFTVAQKVTVPDSVGKRSGHVQETVLVPAL